MQYTRGPWKAELLNEGQSNEHWRIGNKDAGNDIVAECMDYVSGPGERDANARLISAAPDLIEACRAFVGALEKTDVALRMAKQAIAKAQPNNVFNESEKIWRR